MATLEDKLRKIVEKYENTDSDVLVAQIIQAFKDEGWVKVDLRYTPPMDVFTTNPKYMTGQEWYERFENELGNTVVSADNVPAVVLACKESAKKASGLQ